MEHDIIGRESELFILDKGFAHNKNIIIQGMAGIGKTTLINLYLEQYPHSFRTVYYLNGYELELQREKLKSLEKNLFAPPFANS